MHKSRLIAGSIAVALSMTAPAFAAQAHARPATVSAEDCTSSRGGKIKYDGGRRVCQSNDSRVDGLPIRG
ncbi:hypothetical protein ACFXHA_03485 [Nocardia sp. NPDC059240]|uniref:hypothetical protein n=1 Tax=Nocardia sp. NPDC059240 TaxID=3346786 RepID=UPI0036A79B2D